MSEDFDADVTARRFKRLVAGAGLGGGGATESGGSGDGLPGEQAARATAARLRPAFRAGFAESSAAVEALRSDGVESAADGLAQTLVTRARKVAQALADGAPAHSLSQEDLVATEAVLNASTRPAIRLEGNDLEDLAEVPGAQIWRVIADNCRQNILTACAATAAVTVRDPLAGGLSWVQGTAWLLAPDLVITNRHVLFPPQPGTRLARRIPGGFAARLRKDIEVGLDFTHHNSPPSPILYRICDILFVAGEEDPVDAAVLKVEPLAAAARRLPISRERQDELARLYVIGHPGLMRSIPREVRAVFGDLDEKKRVSFGDVMNDIPARPDADIIHDASTIGGYSGGCILPLQAAGPLEAVGLHYWGDVTNGNRGVSAAALRGHPELSRFLPDGA